MERQPAYRFLHPAWQDIGCELGCENASYLPAGHASYLSLLPLPPCLPCLVACWCVLVLRGTLLCKNFVVPFFGHIIHTSVERPPAAAQGERGPQLPWAPLSHFLGSLQGRRGRMESVERVYGSGETTYYYQLVGRVKGLNPLVSLTRPAGGMFTLYLLWHQVAACSATVCAACLLLLLCMDTREMDSVLAVAAHRSGLWAMFAR